MLSCVLDTNVIVAALRSSVGAAPQLLLLALHHRFVLLLAVPLLLEYEAVLTRPEHLAALAPTAAEVASVLDGLAAVAKPVRLSFRWRPQLPDADDDIVLETAINGGSTAIVTLNQRDFAGASKRFACAIWSPGVALRNIRSSMR